MLTRVARKAALAPATAMVSSSERSGSGRRAASPLILLWTSEAGGALPPLMAVSAAVMKA